MYGNQVCKRIRDFRTHNQIVFCAGMSAGDREAYENTIKAVQERCDAMEARLIKVSSEAGTMIATLKMEYVCFCLCVLFLHVFPTKKEGRVNT